MDKILEMAAQEDRIRAYLAAKRIRIGAIARETGFTSALVTYVIDGKRKNPRVRDAIATHLGMSVNDLWPDESKKAA